MSELASDQANPRQLLAKPNKSQGLTARVWGWALKSEASTRSSALIRIFLPCVLWAQWAYESLLFRHAGWAWYLTSLTFFATTTLYFVGLWTRVAGIGLALVINAMVFVHGHLAGRWVHHFELAVAPFTIYAACLPAGRSWSVDRWLACRRARRLGQALPRERGNVWALRLLALHLATIYVWTALEKFNPAFLQGVKMQEYLLQYYVAELPDSLAFEWACKLVSWLTIALEFALAIGLFWAPTRKWLFWLGLGLHGAFYVLLPVQVYTAVVWVGYLAFLDPDGLHRLVDDMMDRRVDDCAMPSATG